MEHNAKLEELLKTHKKSVTKPRRAVFEVLKRLNEPVAVPRLASLLQGVDRASVYRTVELFESTGIIQRVWTGFKSKVELSEEFSSHHHHFSCKNCHCTFSLESEELEKSLKQFQSDKDFEITDHIIELSGLCRACK